MREILFKAKRIDNGEWVYGSPLQSEIPANEALTKCEIHERFADCFSIAKHEVDPSTVCQYIWLNEGGIENGKKLFLGDLMKSPSGYIFEIIWFDEEMRIALKSLNTNHIYNFNISLYELVGNIHDKTTGGNNG